MIQLRRAKEEDLLTIQLIAKKTWPIAYKYVISTMQIDYMLNKMYDIGTLLEQLQEGHIFLIASLGAQDLGFAGYSVIDSQNQIYKLHKLYVLPEAHGKGVGKILINEVVKQARESGGNRLELNVNRHNKAREFYKKGGFTVKESVDLDIGNGFFMNDYVMEKRFL